MLITFFGKSAFFWLITFEARELCEKTTHFCTSQRDAFTRKISCRSEDIKGAKNEKHQYFRHFEFTNPYAAATRNNENL